MKKIGNFLKWFFIVIAILFVTAICAFKIYTGNYYKADSKVLQLVENLFDKEVHSYSNSNGTVFLPVDQDAKAVIVFYPGGKVEHNAYNSLMYSIASKGYICLLPKMPENLPILKIDAADAITKSRPADADLADDLDWYLAGHSLGGVAASAYISDNPEIFEKNFRGLILCASYPNNDISDMDIRLLSIYGSNDHVLNLENYEASKSKWPKDSEEYVIEGGIHSYFGSYGIQAGDGEPAITDEEQITETADIIDEWISKG